MVSGLSTYACMSKPGSSAACCLGMGAAGFAVGLVASTIAAALALKFGVVAEATATASEASAVGLIYSVFSDAITLVVLNCD